MQTDSKLGNLLWAFIVVLVGITLIDIWADSAYLATTLSGATNESITLSSATAETITNESITITNVNGTVLNCDLASVIFFGNGTNSTHLDDVNITQHVNITGTREIIVSGERFPANGVYNISYTHVPSRTGSTAEDDLTGLSFFGNGTNSTHLSSVAVATEVNWTDAGVITTSACHFGTGSYNTSYSYEGTEYVVDSTSRRLINIIAIFFALFILAVAYLFVRKALPEIVP